MFFNIKNTDEQVTLPSLLRNSRSARQVRSIQGSRTPSSCGPAHDLFLARETRPPAPRETGARARFTPAGYALPAGLPYRVCSVRVLACALHLLDQDALSYRSKIRVLIIYRACAQVVQWASQHCIKDKVSFWGSETLKIVPSKSPRETKKSVG